MRRMKRNTFINRCRDGIENNGFAPIPIYTEFESNFFITGSSRIVIDERMNNCFTAYDGTPQFDYIIAWLDAQKVRYTLERRLCRFENSDPQVMRFIFIDNGQFSDAENFR